MPCRPRWKPIGCLYQLTLGAGKACDVSDFVADLRQKCVTPHVAHKQLKWLT
jgi:hypothetical protein